MKKLLFVSDSLSVGGLEKSLVNLLNSLDYNRYSIDLYLFNKYGELISNVNGNVNILPPSPHFSDFYSESIFKSALILATKFRFDLVFYRFLWSIKPRLLKLINVTYNPDTEFDWVIKKKTMHTIGKAYDIAIGYAEGSAICYIIDCINAKKKIGWIHTDVSEIHNGALEKRVYQKLDHLITVSENSKCSIIEIFPELEEKVLVIPNILNFDEIDRLSEETPAHMDLTSECLKIVSVGRLVELKGFHLCIEACYRLIKEGFNIKWYIVGEGDYRGRIEEEITKYNLTDSVFLVGETTNPYSYIMNADICVQPSEYEGKSVVIEEEKYLRKVIVASDIKAFREVLVDGQTGILVERSPQGIYEGVKRVISNPNLSQAIKNNISNDVCDSRQIISCVESLLD